MENETIEELTKEPETHQIMWAEMSPDIYAGESLNEVKARWHTFCDGDMDSDHLDVVTLDANLFPPGAKISITVPCCPRCGHIQEMCEPGEDCDFNWSLWRDNKYQ